MASRLSRIAASCAAALTITVLAACGPEESPAPAADPASPAAEATTAAPSESATTASPSAQPTQDGHAHTKPAKVIKPKPLRAGEERLTLQMAAPYTPSAPSGTGTDDYRCFLLDPKLKQDHFLTGTFVQPGNAEVVHHVILFQVPPDQVAGAQALDASTPDEGWTCFGNSGLDGGGVGGLDSAPWLGAWAPGGSESVNAPGFGKLLKKGTQIVMQVHYNLLAGASPDVSETLLRLAPGKADITPLETMLMPAPVEMKCRPEHSDGPLCTREAAIADVKERFGNGPGSIADALHLLCNSLPVPTNPISCDRTIGEPTTIRGVAGHMHLLGRSIKIEVNPDTPNATTVLDIPVWNFDDQGNKPIEPVTLQPWDVVRVTCKHVQWLRDELPQFEGIPDKYVVWGEGTTDEMCLGILTVTRP